MLKMSCYDEILLRAGDVGSSSAVLVAVPRSVLVRESSVFSAMLTNSDEALDKLEDKIKQNRDNSTGIATHTDEKDENSFVLKIDITGFNGLSVKILFEFIQGYKSMMEENLDVEILTDIIRLCDFYDMPQFVDVVASKLEQVDVNIDNMMTVMNIVMKYENIEIFQPVAAKLEEKCIEIFIKCMDMTHKLAGFVCTNADNLSIVARLCSNAESQLRYNETETSEEQKELIQDQKDSIKSLQLQQYSQAKLIEEKIKIIKDQKNLTESLEFQNGKQAETIEEYEKRVEYQKNLILELEAQEWKGARLIQEQNTKVQALLANEIKVCQQINQQAATIQTQNNRILNLEATNRLLEDEIQSSRKRTKRRR